nr:hypothetical protein [Tanacetum cinerariifolium]
RILRQAYLVGTYTESEPFEDHVETETPESPHTVAPPTSQVEESKGSDTTTCIDVHILPVMSPSFSVSIAEVAAMPDSEFCNRKVDRLEDEDDKEEEEVNESLDSNSESEDAEDEGRTIEDQDPAAGDEGLAAREEGLSMEIKSLGLGRDESLPEGQQRAALVVETAMDPERPERVLALRQPTLTTWIDPKDGRIYINVPTYPLPTPPVQTPPSPEWSFSLLHVSPAPSIVPSPISPPMISLTFPSPGFAVGDEGLGMGVESLGLGGDEAVPEGQGSGSKPEPERLEGVSTLRQPTLTTWIDPEDGRIYIDVLAYPPPAPPVQTLPSPEWSSGSLHVSPAHSIVPLPISSPMISLTIQSPVASPATDEAEGFLTELGAQVETHEGLIRDHMVRSGELSPALFERYDRDIGELFTRLVLALEAAFKRELQEMRGRVTALEQERDHKERIDLEKRAAPVMKTAVGEPLGLGYRALRRRDIALREGHMPSVFEVGQGSRSALEPKRPDEVSALRQPTLTTWIDPEDGRIYIDVPAYPPPAPPVQTPPSPEWLFGSLPVSPALSIVLSPISSPMISLIVPSPIASPATAEAGGFLTELGTQVEMQGGLIRDHTVRLGELSPALLERYDKDIGELFTRPGAVRDEIFSQRYKLRGLEHEQERTVVAFGALWRPKGMDRAF